MPSPKHRAAPSGSTRLALMGMAALAFAVVLMAVPRFVAGGLAAVAPSIREGQGVNPQEGGDDSVLLLEHAQAWSWSADRGALLAALYQEAQSPKERETLAELVAKSPLHPQQWLRLAHLQTPDAPQQALQAWRMSVMSGRVYPSLMERRLQTGIALRSVMTPSDLALLDDQTRLSYILRPQQVVAVMMSPQNTDYRDRYAEIVASLSPADIDAIIRIYALH